MATIPERSVERLSQYRRTLLNCQRAGKTHIFSHELANMHNLTPVQVRRDIMLIGYNGQLRKGYDVGELAAAISDVIDADERREVAIVGLGDLGRAITNYFSSRSSQFKIVAAFDIDPAKINILMHGIQCYHVREMKRVITERSITIGIITVPPESAEDIAEQLIDTGIKGVLNFTSVPLSFPEHIYVEHFDMLTSLEKVSYYIK